MYIRDYSMNVCITGGAGFIGSHTVSACLKAGHTVSVIDNLSHGFKDNIPSGVSFYNADIRDVTVLEKVKKEQNPEALIHLAAQISVPDSLKKPEETFAINTEATKLLLDILKPQKVVFASSGGAIYGDPEVIPTPEDSPLMPTSPYGESKKRAEVILNEYFHANKQAAVTLLRYANVYGPHQPHDGGGVVAIICKALKDDEEFILNGDGNQTRDFVYVEDIVKANLKALDQSAQYEIFNIGTGGETQLNNVIKMLQGVSRKALTITQEKTQDEVVRSVLNSDKAKEWGWSSSVSIEDGLAKTWEWWSEKKSKH